MRIVPRVAASLSVALVAACLDSGPTAACCTGAGELSLRVLNAYTTPVDVLIDGRLAVASLAAGGRLTAAPAPGAHTLEFRPSGGAQTSSLPITITEGALSTIAVVRATNGSVSSAVLDDTNSVVPAGATKVRVLHLAPNAGALQVYRTQPDVQTPVVWQTPFDYQPEPTSVSAPFYQSTVGTWEIRVWQTPADESGWVDAPVKVAFPLASGQKRTVVILDGVTSGVRIELL